MQTGDLQMPRAPCSRKTNGTQHACTYILLFIRTPMGTYLVCCFVQGGLRGCAVLCFALLAVQRHTYSYILRLLYKMLEDIHAGSRQLCMLASVVVWYVRKRKHCKARHSTAQQSTARHRTQGTTPHGTARRCAAPLS